MRIFFISSRKLLELINSARLQVTGTMCKNPWYFYTPAMKNLKKEMKEAILFTIPSELIKYLEINFIF